MSRAAKVLATVLAALTVGFFGSVPAVADERLVGGAGAQPSPAVQDQRDRLRDGAVVIRASGAQNDGIGAGTIVAVAGNTVRIVTANHLAAFGSLTLRFEDGSKIPAHIVVTLPGRDLAIVEAVVPAPLATSLHAAPIGEPQTRAAVHVWGSGYDGPAFEPAAISTVGAELPDGAVDGRYALRCALCHEGDSGGGVFDERGRLVGVYVGYFGGTADRVSVAELPADAARLARETPFPPAIVGDAQSPAWKIARSNTSTIPVTVAALGGSPATTAERNVASISDVSAVASAAGRATSMVRAAAKSSR